MQPRVDHIDSVLPRSVEVYETLTDASGASVARDSMDISMAPGASAVATQKLPVKNPKLWHPEHPNLYKLTTYLMEKDRVTDWVENRIGIRQVRFTVADGMLSLRSAAAC